MHGHERPITHLKYSPDGDVFFSASKDSTPTMWRAKDGERLGVFYGHNGSVFQLDTTSNLVCFCSRLHVTQNTSFPLLRTQLAISGK